jgi:hypothetical protein
MGFRVLEKPCDAATLKAAIAIPAGTTAAKR